jgi:hypothetical protein
LDEDYERSRDDTVMNLDFFPFKLPPLPELEGRNVHHGY